MIGFLTGLLAGSLSFVVRAVIAVLMVLEGIMIISERDVSSWKMTASGIFLIFLAIVSFKMGVIGHIVCIAFAIFLLFAENLDFFDASPMGGMGRGSGKFTGQQNGTDRETGDRQQNSHSGGQHQDTNAGRQQKDAEDAEWERQQKQRDEERRRQEEEHQRQQEENRRRKEEYDRRQQEENRRRQERNTGGSAKQQESQAQMNFFDGCEDWESIATHYKKLMAIYHPDNRGGNAEFAKMINAQYEELKKRYNK